MYLPGEVIRGLLSGCGYEGLDEVYISCEYLCNKHKGNLFSKIEHLIGDNLQYIHIGDNYSADYIGARMAGWSSYFYEGVNVMGKPYRPEEMTGLESSLYKGIVNAKLHNGLDVPGKYYEFGYAYGGILACGYCAWLNEYAKMHHVDKFLFSGRDMYTVHKIYNDHYRQIDNDYIMLSRYASLRFSFEYTSEYFVISHLKARASIEKLTIAETLEELGISDLLPYFKEHNIDTDDIFTQEKFADVEEAIYQNKGYLLESFEEEKQAALAYYLPLVSGCSHVAVVDLGWQGTNAINLKYLLENHCKNLKVDSLLMCSTGREFLKQLLTNGTMDAFCFHPKKNVELGDFSKHALSSLGRYVLEGLFTSTERSLMGFSLNDDGTACPEFFEFEDRNVEDMESMIEGMRGFAADFNKTGIGQSEIKISGYDALEPAREFLLKNEQYILNILSEIDTSPWIGETKSKDVGKIHNIMQQESET